MASAGVWYARRIARRPIRTISTSVSDAGGGLTDAGRGGRRSMPATTALKKLLQMSAKRFGSASVMLALIADTKSYFACVLVWGDTASTISSMIGQGTSTPENARTRIQRATLWKPSGPSSLVTCESSHRPEVSLDSSLPCRNSRGSDLYTTSWWLSATRLTLLPALLIRAPKSSSHAVRRSSDDENSTLASPRAVRRSKAISAT